jgi:hypothetical protein
MHHALAIPELLLLIFEMVRTDTRAARALVNLARTCHLFNTVAIPLLWAALDSPSPLLGLLPHDEGVLANYIAHADSVRRCLTSGHSPNQSTVYITVGRLENFSAF